MSIPGGKRSAGPRHGVGSFLNPAPPVHKHVQAGASFLILCSGFLLIFSVHWSLFWFSMVPSNLQRLLVVGSLSACRGLGSRDGVLLLKCFIRV
jgi:hypothetical protein